MPRVQWSLRHGRPCIELALTLVVSGQLVSRIVVADTGAGSDKSAIDLLLDEDDCMLAGGKPDRPVTLAGAFSGAFPTYILPVQIPALAFNEELRIVGVPSVPAGFDGLACFRFINRFSYGNFGDPAQFGLEA